MNTLNILPLTWEKKPIKAKNRTNFSKEVDNVIIHINYSIYNFISNKTKIDTARIILLLKVP